MFKRISLPRSDTGGENARWSVYKDQFELNATDPVTFEIPEAPQMRILRHPAALHQKVDIIRSPSPQIVKFSERIKRPMGNYRTTSYHKNPRSGGRRRRTRKSASGIDGSTIAGIIGIGIFFFFVCLVVAQPRATPAGEPIPRTESMVEETTLKAIERKPPPLSAVAPTLSTQRPSVELEISRTLPSTIDEVVVSPGKLPQEEITIAEGTLPKWDENKKLRHRDLSNPVRVHECSFFIQTKMPTLPSVRCDYLIPLDSNGHPLSTSADLVLVFPYPTETDPIKGFFSQLAFRHGFSVIALRFPGMSPKDGINGNDKSKWYYWPESGAGDTWIEAIGRVRKIAGFPDRQVFAVGLSGGGSAAGLFANAHPELVGAIANMAGRILPDKTNFFGPTLIAYGAHDYVAPPIEEYLERAIQDKVQLVYYTYPPDWRGRGEYELWQHQFRGAAEDAFLQWFIALADLRIDNGGTMPNISSWPVKTDLNRFPSTEFSELLSRVPLKSLVKRTSDRSIISAIPEAAATPRGTVFWFSGGLSSDTDESIMDTEYIAGVGWNSLTVSSSLSTLSPSDRTEIPKQLSSGKNHESWVLVVENAKNIQDLLSLRQKAPLGVVLCTPTTATLESLIKALAGKKTPILVIGSEGQISSLQEGKPSQLMVQWKSIKYKNIATRHYQCCLAIGDFLKRIQPEK